MATVRGTVAGDLTDAAGGSRRRCSLGGALSPHTKIQWLNRGPFSHSAGRARNVSKKSTIPARLMYEQTACHTRRFFAVGPLIS